MSALESLMQPVARLLNRGIRDSIEGRELCRKLDGRTIAVEIRNGPAVVFLIEAETIDLTSEADREADATVTGSIASLARMAAGGSENMIRDGSIQITGDAITAQAFQKLLKLAKPDLEEELSGFVGDTAAFRIGEAVRAFENWSRGARETMGENIREYLQEEGRELPSRYEVDKFRDRVNTLRDDVDRIEARINRLKDKP